MGARATWLAPGLRRRRACLAPGWPKRALAVCEWGRWGTARGPAPRRTGTAGGALAACAAVCVAVIATVMASRGVTA